MLDDQTYTERQRVAAQPGTCVNCHASTYVAYKKLGNGDIFAGFEALNHMPYAKPASWLITPWRASTVTTR